MLGLTNLAAPAHAFQLPKSEWTRVQGRADFRQSGEEYKRLLRIAQRVWLALDRPLDGLEVGVVERVSPKAAFYPDGKFWVSHGLLAAFQSEAELAAWVSQFGLGCQKKLRGEALDHAAFATQLAAGYDPRAILSLWSRWAQSPRLRNASRFRDFPVSPKRLAAMRVRIEKLGYLL